uniref:Hexosyltransferase n=1 Tax=Biomphalaria glabrata TaxID=6526 RepID=A0A2C9M6D8_BIOGL
VYFFVGQVKTFAAQSNLVAENVKYNDVIQGSFYDAYVNLTYKAIFVFKWLNQHCQGLRLLLRLDDDVFAGVHQFFDAWKSLVKTEANTIMCDAESNDKVRREGKWLVKRSQIPEDRYFFTHCLGYFVALTPDLVPKIEYSARRTTFFWIDDIFIYGFVAKKVGANSGVIWEEKKKKFKAVTIKDNLILEHAYQKYLLDKEMKKSKEGPTVLENKFEVDFDKMILVKPRQAELRRSFADGIWVQMRQSPHSTQLHAKINRLQFDNQLRHAVFPTILSPLPPPRSVAAESSPKRIDY